MPSTPRDPRPVRSGDGDGDEPVTPMGPGVRFVPVGVLAVEATVLLGLAIGAVLARTDERTGAVVEAVTFALMAAGLVAIAVGVLRGRGWSRGAVVTTQLIVGATALAWGGASWLTLVVLLPALVALWAVLAQRPSMAIYGSEV